MNPQVISEYTEDGVLNLELELSAEDVAQAFDESCDQLAEDFGMSSIDEVRTRMPDEDIARFATEYTLSKAANYAMHQLEITPAASPEIDFTDPIAADEGCTFTACIFPRPQLKLASTDPFDLSHARIPMPGVSQAAAAAGEDVAYISDEALLKIEIPKRLMGEFTTSLKERAYNEFAAEYERKLKKRGMSVQEYCKEMNMDEKQYGRLMTMESTKQLYLNLTLELFAEAFGYEASTEEVDALLEEMAPGNAARLRMLYKRHGDLYLIETQVLRRKAYEWIVETAY